MAYKNKLEQPFFSVIITTYNRASLLLRAIQSLMNQTEKNWEAIIVDDGSTDNTQNCIQAYLKKDKRVQYFKLEHVGAVAAKNKAIELSKGIYVTFLDSDDEYKSNHLESRKNILLQNKAIQFLHGGVTVLGNQFVPDCFNYSKLINIANCYVGGTYFIKKELFKSVGYFNYLPLGSDTNFIEKLQQAGIEIFKTEESTYIYHREENNSITNNIHQQTKT